MIEQGWRRTYLDLPSWQGGHEREHGDGEMCVVCVCAREGEGGVTVATERAVAWRGDGVCISGLGMTRDW